MKQRKKIIFEQFQETLLQYTKASMIVWTILGSLLKTNKPKLHI